MKLNGELVKTKIDFPIDAVYLWVDSSDPVWRKKKQITLDLVKSKGMEVHEDAINECRFTDNDELRYSLRSLERFAPWIRRIHIITDNQMPRWLNERNVHIVSHQEIFPSHVSLPVFNSGAIESVQHRIPGLAEHFISFNDDFFFGRKVSKSDFFLPDGTPKIWFSCLSPKHLEWYSEEKLAKMSSHRARTIRSRQILQERYKIKIPYRISHFPKAMSISTTDELWSIFQVELQDTIRCRFRSTKGVRLPALYAFWMLGIKKGYPYQINGAHQLLDIFRGRLAHLGASLGDKNFKKKCTLIRYLHPMTFCINDSEKASPEDRDRLRRFLSSLFPSSSRFEKK